MKGKCRFYTIEKSALEYEAQLGEFLVLLAKCLLLAKLVENSTRYFECYASAVAARALKSRPWSTRRSWVRTSRGYCNAVPQCWVARALNSRRVGVQCSWARCSRAAAAVGNKCVGCSLPVPWRPKTSGAGTCGPLVRLALAENPRPLCIASHADVKNKRGQHARGKKVTGLAFLPAEPGKLLITSNDSRVR